MSTPTVIGTSAPRVDGVRKVTGQAVYGADVNMPGISGYQLAEQAKALRPELKVILLSGGERDPHGWPLLHKPIHHSDLVRVMAQVGKVC